MRLFSAILVLPFCLAISSLVAVAAPVVPGLHGKHPLNEAQVGRILLSELNCVACHHGDGHGGLAAKGGPDLSEVGRRVSPHYLSRFIADPAKAQPDVTMPDLLSGKSEEERAEVAEAITHFLVGKASGPFSQTGELDGDAGAGRKLFHEVGCVACHAPRDERGKELPSPGLRSLAHLPQKYSHGSLSDFLFSPHQARPSGRMPDFQLSREETRHLSVYLMGAGAEVSKPLQVRNDLAQKGGAYFKQYNCVSCHAMKGELKGKQSVALAKLRPEHGCLSMNPRNVPDFNFSGTQRKAIVHALAKPKEKVSTKERIELALTRFNCIACHSREAYGGPSKGLLPYLGTSQEGLGNEARMPPPLTLVGAKLKLNWMNKVLFDGESVRPYMHTRMPKFGEDNLRFLPGLLAEVDKVEPMAFPEPPRKERGKIRQVGTQLVGDKGLNCIACHNFNGKESPGFKGLDLITSYERLQPSWFYAFMRNPAALRPGIVMPNYWAGGKGRPDVLEGDAAAQVWSIWHYFSYGQGAHTPSGIHSPGSSLEVDDVVRTYRGRSRIAGYRGIAVGFPGGLNYAFNAETGALSGIWRGEFVSVGWGGQGAGSFNPKSRAVSLAQDLPLYALPNDKAAWPLLPMMNKENPVNPDPLYPKNHGYQFQGYSFDDAFVPTFSYRIGNIEVEDVSLAVAKDDKAILKRTLSFDSGQAGSLHLRALVGKIETVSKTTYQTPDLQLTLSQGTVLLRPFGANGNQELLLKLALPKGKSQWNLEYELLR